MQTPLCFEMLETRDDGQDIMLNVRRHKGNSNVAGLYTLSSLELFIDMMMANWLMMID
jgi:hypothetical protein